MADRIRDDDLGNRPSKCLHMVLGEHSAAPPCRDERPGYSFPPDPALPPFPPPKKIIFHPFSFSSFLSSSSVILSDCFARPMLLLSSFPVPEQGHCGSPARPLWHINTFRCISTNPGRQAAVACDKASMSLASHASLLCSRLSNFRQVAPPAHENDLAADR